MRWDGRLWDRYDMVSCNQFISQKQTLARVRWDEMVVLWSYISSYIVLPFLSDQMRWDEKRWDGKLWDGKLWDGKLWDMWWDDKLWDGRW